MRISNIASRLRNRSVVSATILALVGAQAGLAQAATASGPSYGPDSRDLVTHTPIKHVIIIIGENWSFDSLFATYVPKSSEKVWNLLSENIVKPDGSPGMNYSKAPQSSATDTSKYQLAPPSSPYLTLPPALAGGPFAPYGCQLLGINANDCNTPANVAAVTPFENGLAPGYYQYLLTGGNPYGHEPDPRIWYDGVGASSLPGGVYQLTNTTHSPSLPYDSYWREPGASPVPDVAGSRLLRREGDLGRSVGLCPRSLRLGRAAPSVPAPMAKRRPQAATRARAPLRRCFSTCRPEMRPI